MIRLLLVIAAMFLSNVIFAATAPVQATRSVQVNPAQVRAWNRFADRLLAIHHKRVREREVRIQQEIGSYADRPNFFREVSYFDAKTNQLLSRIRWERARPATVHVIELFFYDERGRLERDYAAAYLPRFRNAPIQTLVNVHRYNDGLHAFRQFDASGARLYEYCRGSWFDEPVLIALDEPLIATPDELLESEPYSACFGYMPARVGNYLDPARDRAAAAGGEPTEDQNVQLAAIDLKLRFSPKKASLHLDRCRLNFDILAFDAAIDDCSRALELDEKLDKAYFWRGMARGRYGLIAEGIEDLTRYIERNPDSSLAYTKRGVRHIWNGDMAAAEKDLKRAIAIKPDNAEAHDDLGVVLARRKAYDEAIDHFMTTIRIEPDYYKAHHNLALVLHLTSRHRQALQAVDEALQIGPDSRSSVLLKSNILDALGRTDEAKTLRSRAADMPQGNWSENLAVR